MDDGIRVELDPGKFAQTLREIKAFSPALATATRRRLRQAGDDTVRAVKAEVLGGSARGQGSGLRAGIAAGTKLAIVAGKTRQGVSIVTTSARLSGSRASMVKAYNKGSFRHPVFGDKADWVEQSGRPYFGSVIDGRKDAFAEAVASALDDAVREMQG